MVRMLALALVGFVILYTLLPEPAPDRRILFIGNSYTFGGSVPLQVKRIAGSAKPSVWYRVELHTRGGTSLAQHLAKTDPISAILSDNWDVVVLQDASYMALLPGTRRVTQSAATTLAAAAHEQGAEVLYFAHWSPRLEFGTRSGAVRTIEAMYSRLGQQTAGRVATVGRFWQMAADAGVTGLYAQDGHHASVKGAYAAALAIVAALGDVDPTTSGWKPNSVSAAERDRLLGLMRADGSFVGGS